MVFLHFLLILAAPREGVYARFFDIDHISRKVRATTRSWQPYSYPWLDSLDSAEIKRNYLGVRDDAVQDVNHSGDHTADHFLSTNSSFDWRNTNQSVCIGPVKDQGKCGSCWAESTVESLADRRCIRSNTGQRLALSALDVIACDKLCEGIEKCCRGCTGGYPKLAFKFFEHTGVVSEACMPYNLTRSLLCPLPRCKKPLDDTAYRAKHTKQVLGGAPSMQKEIATFGPIVATFTVFEDFMTYRSGIYKYSGVGKRLGLHAVKVVGWGTDKADGTPYWVAFNSWGAKWGVNGTFNIAVGQCGFEESVYTATPCLDGEICI